MLRLENIHMEIGNKLLLEDEMIEIHEGYIHVIMGESGSGKTTLLHEISLLSDISECTYVWNDIRIDKLSDHEKANIRRNNIGYILQDLELISEELSLRDNLICMTALSGREYDEDAVLEYMHKLNLYSSLDQNVESMSRGERQRFALVLALIKDVDLIICDEPTSALDIENSHELMRYLTIIARDYQKMIVIATHDEIVAGYADKLYHIREQHLVMDGDTDVENKIYSAKKPKDVHKQFYWMYMKAHRKISKGFMKVIYVLMITVLCLSPVVLDDLLDKQQELFELFADNEIIVSNTDERMPYSTYNALYDDIGLSTVNMLKEIDNVSDVRYYWEMDGILSSGNNDLSVKVIPKNIDVVAVSSVLERQLKDNTVSVYLDYNMDSYKMDLEIDEYIVKDYPPRKGADKEIIYVPYDMIETLLKNQGVIASSSVSVICEDIMKVEETMKDIERWMRSSTVSSESIQYLDSINMLKNIQKYITMLRIVLVCGITAVAYIINLMENKVRRREITTLRINGFDKTMFYRLALYENAVDVIIVLFLVILGYVFINDMSIVMLDIVMILTECMFYIVVTKILPVFISGHEVFKRDISSILRDY